MNDTYLHPVTAQLFYFNKKLLGEKKNQAVLMYYYMKKIPQKIMLQSSEIIFQGSNENIFCISIWTPGSSSSGG